MPQITRNNVKYQFDFFTNNASSILLHYLKNDPFNYHLFVFWIEYISKVLYILNVLCWHHSVEQIKKEQKTHKKTKPKQ